MLRRTLSHWFPCDANGYNTAPLTRTVNWPQGSSHSRLTRFHFSVFIHRSCMYIAVVSPVAPRSCDLAAGPLEMRALHQRRPKLTSWTRPSKEQQCLNAPACSTNAPNLPPLSDEDMLDDSRPSTRYLNGFDITQGTSAHTPLAFAVFPRALLSRLQASRLRAVYHRCRRRCQSLLIRRKGSRIFRATETLWTLATRLAAPRPPIGTSHRQ